MATGQPSPLTAALAKPLHAAAAAIVEPLRGFANAPTLDPQPGDDEIAALLRYLGRRPDWASCARSFDVIHRACFALPGVEYLG